MKLTNIQKTSVCAAAMLVLGLSSCENTLYVAAKAGDLETVRMALPEATATERNHAALLAYEQRHNAVVDELAMAGAAVAPANVAGKMLVLQQDYTSGDMDCDLDSDVFETPWKNVDSFWNPHVVLRPDSNVTSLQWTDGNIQTTTKSSKYADETTKLTYVRSGVNGAIVTNAFSSIGLSRGILMATKYQLTFDSTTSGTYKSIDANQYCTQTQNTGRFWLKDAPATPEKR